MAFYLLSTVLQIQLSQLLFLFHCQPIELLNALHDNNSWTTAGQLCIIMLADGSDKTLTLEICSMLRIKILSNSLL